MRLEFMGSLIRTMLLRNDPVQRATENRTGIEQEGNSGTSLLPLPFDRWLLSVRTSKPAAGQSFTTRSISMMDMDCGSPPGALQPSLDGEFTGQQSDRKQRPN
ncbi:hypothetical protein RvY_14187 [Ramazzottius varieornatus]|uniref:Uncharacterized protein n=1 Tax=Ramazzottius varieornatus TaxID=947166 RepID=A0A1D1VVJ2_RAMVA|nr:hypothetical protein RvY_14187 [Ramazzottius varieornatus]